MQQYTSPGSPNRGKLPKVTALLVAGSVTLSGCGISKLFKSDYEDSPFPSSAPSYAPPTLTPEQQDANAKLYADVQAVAERILDDAANPSSCAKATDTFGVGNGSALQAHGGRLIDSRLPEISAIYEQGPATITITSQDEYYPTNDPAITRVFNGITIVYGVPLSPNSLDTAIGDHDQLQVADFRNALRSGELTLQNVTQQAGIPYDTYMLQPWEGGTYQLSHEVGDPTVPTTGQVASPGDIAAFDDRLSKLETTLSQAIGSVACP